MPSYTSSHTDVPCRSHSWPRFTLHYKCKHLFTFEVLSPDFVVDVVYKSLVFAILGALSGFMGRFRGDSKSIVPLLSSFQNLQHILFLF